MRRQREEPRPFDPGCPFCPGNEAQTTEELLRIPEGEAADAPGWRVRVVGNKYPVLLEEMPAQACEPGTSGQVEPAVGRHEVIVETPIHDADLASLSSEEIFEVLRAARDRFAAAVADPRVQHVVIFRNQGRLAHASLTHPHSQLVGLPFVPPLVAQVLERARAHATAHGAVLLLEMAEAEVEDGARLIEATERLATFVPFAAAHDHEIWIVPRQLPPRFDRADDQGLRGLGDALRRASRALAAALGDPDYNLILHTAPLRGANEELLPWYLQMIPRYAVSAGFEMGIGVRILTTAPEAAAETLRSALGKVAGL
jgi:UDPglucose--hexose-1-phosphate uridylyltransferase